LKTENEYSCQVVLKTDTGKKGDAYLEGKEKYKKDCVIIPVNTHIGKLHIIQSLDSMHKICASE
jgi:hypothetical protein